MEGRHTTDWVWWKQVCPGLLAGKPECSLCAYRPGVDIAGRRKNWQEMYVKAFFGAQDWPLLGRTREVSEKGQRAEKHCHGACGVGERVGGKQLLQCELLWFGGIVTIPLKWRIFSMLWPWPAITTVFPAGHGPCQCDVFFFPSWNHVTLFPLFHSSTSAIASDLSLTRSQCWLGELSGLSSVISFCRDRCHQAPWPSYSTWREPRSLLIFLYVPDCQGDRHGQIRSDE